MKQCILFFTNMMICKCYLVTKLFYNLH